jgi:hypothetical protein
MNYSIYLTFVMATVGNRELGEKPPADVDVKDALEPAFERILQLLRGFSDQPVSGQTTFELEQELQSAVQELARVGVEWAYNHVEPKDVDLLPPQVDFESERYTRLNQKTPQEIATLFGKIRLWRTGYRSTYKTGDPMIFPLVQQLGIVAGASPALAERAAYYQAEAGATQRRTLQRLKHIHGVDWGTKKLREVIEHVSVAMTVERHEVQVKKLLELLEKGSQSKGKHKPVLSVGRDGITIGVPMKGTTKFEVASAGTISILDRRGKRLGTVYLAYMPESKQGTMSKGMTDLLTDVLKQWQQPLPRLCYVTDAGDNETTYFHTVLQRMKHPRTGEKLEWIRVVDFYHASQRLWTMAEAMFGSGPTAKSWARRMLKLLKKPNGIRRVLNSASVLRSRHKMTKRGQEQFREAYEYLRKRTKYLRYAAYKRVGLPLGSGVTEAACKTLYTQRLKLSGMRWKKAGAQTILNLRVLLLSNVWAEAYQQVLANVEKVTVAPQAKPQQKTPTIAA